MGNVEKHVNPLRQWCYFLQWLTFFCKPPILHQFLDMHLRPLKEQSKGTL